MSVLIEALTVIARRINVEIGHPGGVDDLLRIASERTDVRYAIADEQLVAISTFEPAVAKFFLNILSDASLLFSNGDPDAEAVVVDMEIGPPAESPWLTIVRHPHGFTTATLSAAPHPRLVTPQSWTLSESWSLFREDVRDDGADSVQSLGIDDGIEYLLDFRTGEVVAGPTARSPVQRVVTGGGTTPVIPLLATVDVFSAASRLLTRLGIPFVVDSEHGCVVVPFGLERVAEEDIPYTSENDRLRVMLLSTASRDLCEAVVVLPFFLHTISKGPSIATSCATPPVVPGGLPIWTTIDEESGTIALTVSVARREAENPEDLVERTLVQTALIGTSALITFRRSLASARNSA
jgi:hypothetical protein